MKKLLIVIVLAVNIGFSAPEILAPNQDVAPIDITGRWVTPCFRESPTFT